jgi:Flp pilus assembly protein TadG
MAPPAMVRHPRGSVGRRRRRAQATVEFAVALPFLLVMVLGLVDFSRLLFTYVSLTNAGREMGRVAADSSASAAQVIAAFNNYAIFADPVSSSTDFVTVTVANAACNTQEATATTSTPCTTGGGTNAIVVSATCPLPIAANSTCLDTLEVPRDNAGGGYVQVAVRHNFHLTPFFDAVLSRFSAFSNGIVLESTTTRIYAE